MKKNIDVTLGSSFLDGMATIMDIGATLYQPYLSSPPKPDVEALRSDWINVGNDLMSAITQYGQEIKEK